MTGAAIAAAVFWAAAGLLAYAYAAYPALVLAIASRPGGRQHARAASSPPGVAVVIAAHNEEKHIGERIRNLMWQDYPAERLAVFVGSDGSTDATASMARGAGLAGVVVREFPQRRGKASVLNDLVAGLDQEIVVFTDANTQFERDTVSRLVARFADGAIGAVCGELVLTQPDRSDNQDHRYWRIESRLKAAESDVDGLLGANGGVYAIRRALWAPLPPDTVCDDFVIVMNVAASGSRVVYEPAARAYEETPRDMEVEFQRRVRIGTGNYQSLFGHPEYLTATGWARRWTYFSHKVLRWVTPHLLLVMLTASAAAASRSLFRWLLAAQLAAYALAGIAYATRRRVAWPGPVRLWSLFCVVNLAFAVASVRYLAGNATGDWRRTER